MRVTAATALQQFSHLAAVSFRSPLAGTAMCLGLLARWDCRARGLLAGTLLVRAAAARQRVYAAGRRRGADRAVFRVRRMLAAARCTHSSLPCFSLVRACAVLICFSRRRAPRPPSCLLLIPRTRAALRSRALAERKAVNGGSAPIECASFFLAAVVQPCVRCVAGMGVIYGVIYMHVFVSLFNKV